MSLLPDLFHTYPSIHQQLYDSTQTSLSLSFSLSSSSSSSSSILILFTSDNQKRTGQSNELKQTTISFYDDSKPIEDTQN
ncbi:hypothetical protein BLOT_016624 [Blomia tropicalis]|nr:hypothetical protein BLOT_016624 [Blomia tropicalis]